MVMTARAKLFQNGQSQAVRLPKEYRFDDEKEVDITKIGDCVILSPHKENRWALMFEALEEFSSDFRIERGEQLSDQRDKLFR
jgi:antitoxin VapB